MVSKLSWKILQISVLQLRRFPEEQQVISHSRLKKFMDYDKEVITEMMKNYNYKSWAADWMSAEKMKLSQTL